MIKRTHLEAIGIIKENNPWIEDTWSLGPLLLVHWQNLKHPALSSVSQPRHTWRLHVRSRLQLEFIIQYGVAPHEHN